MASPPTGTITFLFTDIAGSSSRFEQQGDAMHAALARHDAILRDSIERNGGYVFKRWGDAFLAAFSSAPAATAAALEAQIGVRASEEAAAVGELPVRMVLHTGLAEFRDGDYYGDTLNRSDRLLKIAYGGQILLSGPAADLAQPELPPDAHLADLGLHRLRDLQQSVRVFELRHPSLPGGFGPLRSLEYLPTNLPQQLTSFVGREKDIADVRSLLTTNRLLTLTGSGGCGKTRLALQVAADLMDEFPDGVWLVELAALRDEELVTRTICAALDLKEEPGQDPMDGLAAYLRSRKLLLILDNCEHLVATVASVTEKLLRECPALHVLATSREPLAIGGETVWRVPSLSLPNVKKHAKEVPTEALETESVRLFLDRARSLSPAFKLTPAGAAATVEICRRLDGIPLAIELAAAMVNVLSPEQIADRLVDFFRVLSKGSRTALPRHQTLLGAIQWSYDLLIPPQQVLLRRLSVFQGGWTLEAAEDVCSLYGLDSSQVVELLMALINASLVIADQKTQVLRYRLLESVRQFGNVKLIEAGEDELFRERHRDYFVSLAEQAEPHLQGPDQNQWMDRLELDHANLRAAIKWSVDHEARIRIATALHRFWLVRGHVREGRAWMQNLSGKTFGSTRIRANAYNAAGILDWAIGDYERARSAFMTAVSLFRSSLSPEEAAKGLNNLGMVASDQGDFEAAKAFYEESLQLYRTEGNLGRAANVLCNLGGLALERNEYDTATEMLTESLDMLSSTGDAQFVAICRHNLGKAAFKCGDPSKARGFFAENLLAAPDMKDARWVAVSLAGVGTACAAQGRHVEAALLLGAAEREMENTGTTFSPSEALDLAVTLNTLRASLGPDAFELELERGRGMPLYEVMALATTPSAT